MFRAVEPVRPNVEDVVLKRILVAAAMTSAALMPTFDSPIVYVALPQIDRKRLAVDNWLVTH